MITERALLRFAVLAAGAIALSACGGGGTTVSTPPTTTPAPFAYMFGNGFGADFTASSNATPATISTSDVSAVSLTASPIPFPAGTVGSN